MLFPDRATAGRSLGRSLARYAGRDDVLVLALPRGGVPVAYEVARALGAPLDLFLVRKLGMLGNPEIAMGAIASGGVRVLNDELLPPGVRPEEIEIVARRENAELERRERLYRGDLPPPEVRGRTVILVDDGLATGASMRAAIRALRQLGPRRVVVAVPVGAADACRELGTEADEVLCGRTPEPFVAVGLWYDDFSETTDEEVRALLLRARSDETPATPDRAS